MNALPRLAVATIFLHLVAGCGHKLPAAASPPQLAPAPVETTAMDISSDGPPPMSAGLMAAPGNSPKAQPAPPPSRAVSSNTSSPAPVEQRDLLAYSAKIQMATHHVDATLAGIEKAARDLGGYLALRNDRSTVVRVPRANFRQAVTAVEALGQVTHRELNAEDVSDHHTDLEIRLRNAKAMRARLEDLLKSASIADAITLNEQLARATGEIERLEGALKSLNDRVAYSSITVDCNAIAAEAPRPLGMSSPFAWTSQLGLPFLLQVNP